MSGPVQLGEARTIYPRGETLPSLRGAHVSNSGSLCAHHTRGMVGVDVRGLNIDEALGVIRGRSQPLPQQLRNDVDNTSVEAREPLQFLKWLSVRAELTFCSISGSPGLCNCGKS